MARRSHTRPAPTRRVVLATFPDSQILDVTGPLEVFSTASRLLGADAYTTEIVAAKRGPVATSSGIEIVARRGVAEVRGPIDTLIVGGGLGTEAALGDEKLTASARGRRCDARSSAACA